VGAKGSYNSSMATPDEETPSVTPGSGYYESDYESDSASDSESDTDDEIPAQADQENGSRPVMTGWCKKKARFGFKLRYYTLTADGKLYSAKNDLTTKKKHMLDTGETTTLEPAHRADLIIKGQNAKGRPVSITLRFNEPEERDEWVEAFNKFILKEEVMDLSADDQLPATLFKADDLIRLRSKLSKLGEVIVTEEQIVIMMWEMELTPRSVPVTEEGETLLGPGKSKVTVRRYVNQYGTDAAKRLMVSDDPVREAAFRKKPRSCASHLSRSLMLRTPRELEMSDENRSRCCSAFCRIS